HHPYLERVDNSFALRSKAIHALGNIGTPDAVRALGALFEELKDPDEKLKASDDEAKDSDREPEDSEVEDSDEEESDSGMENSDLRAKIVRQLQRLAESGATDEVRGLAKEALSRATAARPKRRT